MAQSKSSRSRMEGRAWRASGSLWAMARRLMPVTWEMAPVEVVAVGEEQKRLERFGKVR